MLTSMICAPFSTCWRATRQRLLEIAVQDQARERLRAGDVGALADVDEQRIVADVERLEARTAACAARSRGTLRGGKPLHRLGDRLDVLGRRAAAAAGDVDEAALRELLEQARRCCSGVSS